MKKIFAVVVAAMLMCAALAGCGNMSMGFGNFTFTHVHFTDYLEGHCATIEKWYDNSTGIEVKTKEFGSLYLSEGSYILVDTAEHCPYCVED